MNKTTYLPKDLLQLIGQYHCRCGVLDCDIKPCPCGTMHCDQNCCEKCKRPSDLRHKYQCVLCTANICHRCVHYIRFCVEDHSCMNRIIVMRGITPCLMPSYQPISSFIHKCNDCNIQDPQLLLTTALQQNKNS